MAELARLVAKELRKRGIWADDAHGYITIPHASTDRTPEDWPRFGQRKQYMVRWPQFDNLTPNECADMIQAEEAERAQGWAGDP